MVKLKGKVAKTAAPKTTKNPNKVSLKKKLKKVKSNSNGISTKKKVKPVKIRKDEEDGSDEPHISDDELEGGSDSEAELGSYDDAEDHKKALERLRETDPEFYQFLQENDRKLLQFNVSDEDDDSEREDDEEQVHVPNRDLEVASDESDFEAPDDEEKKDSRVISLKLLKQWQADIQTDKSNKTIGCVIKAFHAALLRVSANDEEDVESEYKVDGSAVFNGVIQLCVLELGPAVRRFLGLKKGSKQPAHKCKRFVKIKMPLKAYFTDLLKLLGGVTSTNILNVLLKHLHYMSLFLSSFSNLTKTAIKRLVQLWGSAEESVRVVAFLCILRVTHEQQQALLDIVLRSMYMTYVKNSKFVSVTTLPGVNFMRRSLVEMFSLDLNVSYRHVFLYIRQLAINLRNAITTNSKENVQTVYNWQYVNSLKLWGNLLQVNCNKPQLQPLVYPYVQVCLGTIKLIPTAQYYPLRFHVLQMLVGLSKDAGVFIPILPFLMEVLTGYDFNKKHQKVSMKPLQFTCLLRLSKSQMSENGFKDAVIDAIYAQLLEYLAANSHSIAFPDLTLFCKLEIKAFIKKCKVVNYQRKLGQILEKLEQNSQFIEKERAKLAVSLTEYKKIEAWETKIRNDGTPLAQYFEAWNKLHTIKRKKEVTESDKLGDYNLPTIKKHKKVEREDVGDEKVELFPSDSEDEDEEKAKKPARKRKQRGSRKGKVGKEVDVAEVESKEGDIIEDLDLQDW